MDFLFNKIKLNIKLEYILIVEYILTVSRCIKKNI